MIVRIIILLFFYVYTCFQCDAQSNYLADISYPADISFCIADLKFDGQNIKICEFGQGSRSRFKGYDALYGKGKAWLQFWEYLSKYNKPFYIVTPENYALTKKNIGFNINDLQKFGGQLASSLEALEHNQYLKKAEHTNYINSDNASRNPCAISSYDEIVVTNHASFGRGFFANFNLKHPNILITDQASAFFVNSKYETTELFKHPDLQKYRPKNIMCKCVYDKKLVKSITKKLNCEKYVIKPLNASRGSGIIIVDRLHLDKELKKILVDKQSLNTDDSSYKYWITAKDKNFLVEEFVSSKNILVDNKRYDATMRVIFVLSHDMGNINIDFLGAYWKLPSRSLEEYGGLTKMHKSNINKNRKSAAAVDPQDFELIKKEMTQAMSKAYALMLERRKLDLEKSYM